MTIATTTKSLTSILLNFLEEEEQKGALLTEICTPQQNALINARQGVIVIAKNGSAVMVSLQPYSGKFSREKMIVTEKISVSSLLVPPKDAMPPNFVKKIARKRQNSRKIFPSKVSHTHTHTHTKKTFSTRQTNL